MSPPPPAVLSRSQPSRVAPSRPGPSSPAPLRAGPRMVRSARELGAGLAGDARALWPNTARSESKLPAQWGRRECACVCVRVCAIESERGGRGDQLLHTFNTALKRERERKTGDAQIPPRSPKATIPQIIEQNPKNRNRGNGQRLNMDEGIPHLQERQLLEHRDFIG